MLDSTQLICTGATGDSTVPVTAICDLLPPSQNSCQAAPDSISPASWQAAAQQLQQQVLGTKQQVGG